MLTDEAIPSTSTSQLNSVEDGASTQPNYPEYNMIDAEALEAPQFSSHESSDNFWTVDDFWSMQPLNCDWTK